MFSTKRQLQASLWPEKERYPKNRATLKFTAFVFLVICSIWFISVILSPFSPPSDHTAKTAAFETSTTRDPPPPACDQGFSIYTYELPPEFNLGLLRNCKHLNMYTDMCPHVANNGLGQPLSVEAKAEEEKEAAGSGGVAAWFATHQFIAEMIFHARVENHPCRTWEPERADLFYVPFYGGLYASSMFREYNHTQRDELAVRLVQYIGTQPWYGNNNGQDHFLALGRTAWDFMRTDNGPDFGANILLNLPRVQNMSVLTVERQPWKGANQFGIPYPSYFHPSTSAEMMTWQDKMKRSKRELLYCFVGGPRKGLEKAAVRDELIRQCAESSWCGLVKCEGAGTRCHDPKVVLSVMTRSKFCLQAPGDSFTRRSTFDAILAGCIPVFFSPHTAYTQYTWYLPSETQSYSVFLDEERSKKIDEELLKIPDEEVERMRKRVITMIPKLTYKYPNSTRYGFRDVVDVALEALVEKVRSNKLQT